MNQRVLLRLTPSHLLVANTGKAFSKEGLLAVCYTDTSADESASLADCVSEDVTRSWIDDVLRNKRNSFTDRHQLISAGATEQRTASDYAGRLLLELLQNAIDAGRHAQIGYKGIGFRSVLNESAVTEVHSGNLHVRWSDQDARKALNGCEGLPERLPILDLPSWLQPDDQINALNDMGYKTVIRLGLTQNGRDHVEAEWKRLCSDASLLLFIDGQIDIRWESENKEPVQWSRTEDADIVSVVETKGEQPPAVRRWRCFEVADARAAYSINENREFQVSGVSAPRLRCFFSANQSPHPFPNLYLHHAKFDLQSNREAVVLDEDRLHDLARAIELASSSVCAEGDVLDLLQVQNLATEDTERSDTRVWTTTRPLLAESKLQGLGGRSLSELRTCPQNDDLPYRWHDDARWDAWAAFLTALCKHRHSGLAGLPMLSAGVENKAREITLLAFNGKCSLTKKALQQLNWAPVEGRLASASSWSSKVFLPHQGEPITPPAGIEVRFLSPDFISVFKSRAKIDVDPFLKETLGVLEFSALGVIEHSVLGSPVLMQQSSTDDLILFLKRLREADKKEFKKPVESFDWSELVRAQLAQQLHLQCQGNSWPVFRVYAGKSWTHSEFLQEAFGTKRGFLDMEPPTDEAEMQSWQSFYKWLGVGWCPKVLPLMAEVTCKREDKRGWKWNGSEFSGKLFQDEDKPADWGHYCSALHDDQTFKSWGYTPRIKSNWTIDGGSDALMHNDSFRVIGTNWECYRQWTKASVGYSSNAQRDYDNHEASLPSYFAWLMRQVAWVPDSVGRKHVGCDVFEGEGPVFRELSQFVVSIEVRQSEDESGVERLHPDFLKHSGIRSGWNEVDDKDWISWVTKAAQLKLANIDISSNREAVRCLYRALLDHRKQKAGSRWNEQQFETLSNVAIWGIERCDDFQESWQLLRLGDRLPYFVDRGDLADIILPGLRIFPVRLDGLAKKAQIHLGLQRLSEALTGRPTTEGAIQPKYCEAVTERIGELIAYLRVGNEKQDDEALRQALCAVTLQRIKGLQVLFSLDGVPCGEPVQRDHFQLKNDDTSWTVYVDEAACSDERIWEVFAETLLLSCDLPAEKAVNVRDLLCHKPNDLAGKLLKLGVAPETVQHLQSNRPVASPVQQPPPSAPLSSDLAAPEAESDPVPSPDASQAGGSETSKQPPHSTPDHATSRLTYPRRDTQPSDRSGVTPQPSSRPHPEEGMSAQTWLLQQISTWCQKKGLPAPLWEHNYVDITINLPVPILIEAKRIEGMTVHWSSNQIRTAQASPESYIVALLRPDEAEGHKVFWVIRPLDEFGVLPSRRIEWAWRVRPGATFDLGSWNEPESPPSHSATNFHVEIPLLSEWVNKLPEGVEHGLEMILSKRTQAPPLVIQR